MNVTQVSMAVLSGGQSSKVALTTASAQGPVVTQPATLPAGCAVPCTLVLDAAGFVRKGTNPTALSDGTDQYLVANFPYRIELMAGERLAIILASGTGNAYFTPNA